MEKQEFRITSVKPNGYNGFILIANSHQKLNVSISTFNAMLESSDIIVDNSKCITIEDVKAMLPLTLKIPLALTTASDSVYDVRPTRVITVIDYYITDNILITVVDSEMYSYTVTQGAIKEMFPFIKNLKLELGKQLPFQIFIKKMF